MVQINFNANEVSSESGFDPIPPGEYVIKVNDTQEKVAKSGGKYIWIEHIILEGQYKDRRLYNNLNLWNENATAKKIADAQLSQLCKATGQISLTNTVQLHGIPIRVKVGLDTKGDRGPQNRIDKYLFEETPSATVAATTQVAATTATAPGAAPWSR